MLVVINDLLATKGPVLRAGAVVDATLIAAPSSTKNKTGERDSGMHQAKKGNQWYFGMKAHIGADAESGLVHTVRGTPANVNDVTEANSLLRGQETSAFGDAATKALTSGPTPRRRQPGRWRCARANGLRSTKTDRSAR